VVKIRGHHLLCLLGYRGFGYSPTHINKMWQMRELLFSSPDQLQIVDSPDEVCQVCPWLRGDGCYWGEREAEAEVRERDRGAIAKLRLKVGAIYNWQEILQRLKSSLSEDDLISLCSSCQWFSSGYCLEGLRGLKQKS